MRIAIPILSAALSLASPFAYCCKSPLLPEHLTGESAHWEQTYWVVKILDINHGKVTVAATGDFGHLGEIGKPVTLKFMEHEDRQARCAMHLRHGHTYLLRSVSESAPYLISRFDWPVAVDSEDPRFPGYIQDLKRASGRGRSQSLEGTVNGGWLRAAGAGRQYAPAALGWRFWAAPQLHR